MLYRVALAGISVLGTTARLLMLWAPPIVYIFIFLPCWECYDFEASTALLSTEYRVPSTEY